MGGIDTRKTEEILLEAVKLGVNYFDTAYMYSGSEEALGKVLARNGLRDSVYIAGKLPIVICRGAGDFDKYFDRELERLRTDHIDYYLMHMLMDMDQWKKLCGWGIEGWIRRKRESGAIRRIGFSFHGARDEFLRILDAYDWGFCQIQYNYSDENFQAGVTGLKRAAEKGIPVIVMEPLLGGKLANGLPPEALRVFREANSDLPPAAWGLKWLWNQPEVTVVLSGMSDLEQVRENTGIAGGAKPGMLSESENGVFERVAEILRASYRVQCTGCNYCMPCPENVNIPACFAAFNTSFSMGRWTGVQQYSTGTGQIKAIRNGAGQCVRCGLCETRCPQKIKIRDSLAMVKKRMEPFWYRWTMAVVRAALGVRKTRLF
jgi:predicted aldo/keto reductase-like oxidoreductase